MDLLHAETTILADDDGALSRLAWKFGQPDRIGDMIEPGAFKDTTLPLPLLFGHDQNDAVGIWDAADDKDDWLHVTGKLLVDNVPRAREAHAGRTIKSLELQDASLVTLPMHPGEWVASVKSAVEALCLAVIIQRATAQLATG